MRALLVAALLLPAAAAAAPTLALRVAWAPAVGSAAGSVSMSEAVAWQVPLQADALWSWGGERGGGAAGLYGSWGPGQAGTDACLDGASCSARVLRAGAQALGRFPRWRAGAAAWLGGALGWEWASHRRARAGARTTTRWSGPELSVQGGVDWRIADWGRRGAIALGPFALVGLGQYRSVSVDTPEESGSGAIADRSVHGWIHLGVRGTWDL